VNGVEALPSLAPAFFFSIRLPVKQLGEKKELDHRTFRLPHYSWLLDEEPFSDVYLGWHEGGIAALFEIGVPFDEPRYPRFEEGDSLELFIDTRDMKQATYASRFCHHFLILPAEVQGVRALEITRLRADDKRPLCDPDEIGVDVNFSKRGATIRIDLPSNALYGLDRAISESIGFTYRINRSKGPAQHFSVSSRSCNIEQYPALWASMLLEKKR